MSTIKVNGIRGVGASTDAISINNTDGTCTAKITNNLSNRNKIINGAMEVNQRTNTTSVTGGVDAYYLDRFKATCGGGGGFSVTQETDAPTGLLKSLKVAVTSADSDIQASDWARIYTKLEGYTTADFGWGASGAKTVTLSFWVKSSLTGNFALAVGNDGQSGYQTYSTQYAISSANTWEKKTVTIAGPTSGTFAKDNTRGIHIFWGMKGGSDYNATQNQWNTTDTWFPSGSTQVVATNGATWFITGVQLELGSTATDFEYRSYGDELLRCRRYYCTYVGQDGNGNNEPFIVGFHRSATVLASQIIYPVAMRTPPSIDAAEGSNYWYIGGTNTGDINGGFSITTNSNSHTMCWIYATESGATVGQGATLMGNNSAAYFALSAEL